MEGLGELHVLLDQTSQSSEPAALGPRYQDTASQGHNTCPALAPHPTPLCVSLPFTPVFLPHQPPLGVPPALPTLPNALSYSSFCTPHRPRARHHFVSLSLCLQGASRTRRPISLPTELCPQCPMYSRCSIKTQRHECGMVSEVVQQHLGGKGHQNLTSRA